MKINWGTGIVIAFALFMAFILYFVFEVQSNSKYDNDLVVEEYYKHDAHFGDEMNRVQNADDLIQKPIISVLKNGISVVFPKEFSSNKIKGNVSLYRPSNKKLDFEVPISMTSPTLLIPKKRLLGGLWDITINWKYNSVEYISKETIYF